MIVLVCFILKIFYVLFFCEWDGFILVIIFLSYFKLFFNDIRSVEIEFREVISIILIDVLEIK